MFRHTLGQYLRHSVKPYYLPVTLFAGGVCWVVAYGTLEIASRMVSDGNIILAAVSVIASGLIISGGLYLYAKVTQMIQPHN